MKFKIKTSELTTKYCGCCHKKIKKGDKYAKAIKSSDRLCLSCYKDLNKITINN